MKNVAHGATERAGYRGRDIGPLIGGADARSAFDGGGLIEELKKALAELARNEGMDHHL